jgi:protein tyrosine kinase modulator
LNPRELLVEIIEHARGMWRYRWWTVGGAWALALLGWLYVYSIPDIYRASAKVFVDSSSLLRPLMQGLAASSDPLNEVQLVSRAVLTRPNLEKVAYETDLALRAHTPEEMEVLVTMLQERIIVSGGHDNIYSIEYEDNSRDKARDVVAAVLDAFTESAIGNEGDDAAITERALANEIDVHERRLREAEETLAKFKQDNLGYMPGEYGDYYNRLQGTLAKLAQTQEKLRQLVERRDELRRQIEGEDPVFGIMPPTVSTSHCSRGAQIAELRRQLDELSVNFTEKHPRIVTLEETIAQLESQCQAETANAPVRSTSSTDQRLEVNPVYQNLRIQLSTAEADIAELRSRADTEEGEVERLRRDVDKITEVETQLKQLNRDYAVIQTRHQELIKRWEDLQAKKRLDPLTDNVKYRRIEPPFAAAEPVGPNRPLLIAAVLVGALGGGLGVAFGLSQLNPVFFSRTALAKAVKLPVLGAISLIVTPEVTRRRRVAAQTCILLLVLLLITAGASIVFAPQGSALVQAMLSSMYT